MKASRSLVISWLSILVFLVSCSTSDSNLENFIKCLQKKSYPANSISKAIFTPQNSSFTSVLRAYIKNQRFSTPATPKPLAIVAAKNESHVTSTVLCAKDHGLQIRIRSGGHDTEGLSYRSDVPFIILDMFNLRSINVDIATETAWVQAGATVGELYYQIAKESKVHGFPAGMCPTVAAGGHFSGGGYGTMLRKYGLSVDNIIDAKFVDVNGRILDRKSMGEDTFWAIRGGGGASFGVILSWKIKLVRVPANVTVFRLEKTLEQGATDIVYQWQKVAYKLDRDLFIRAVPHVVNRTQKGDKTVQVSFLGLFLGETDRLLLLMNKTFPKLGLRKQDCIGMSWLESNVFWADLPQGSSTDALLDRTMYTQFFIKIKSDYVQKTIPNSGLKSIWKLMIKAQKLSMQWTPYGGRMDDISASETPFPHRKGKLFKIGYVLLWTEQGGETVIKDNIELMRAFYDAMTPFVSKSPRGVLPNYRDLDIGRNPSNSTYFGNASIYGHKYFNGNFDRLVLVKNKVDPLNFFKHEQSIPPLIYY